LLERCQGHFGPIGDFFRRQALSAHRFVQNIGILVFNGQLFACQHLYLPLPKSWPAFYRKHRQRVLPVLFQSTGDRLELFGISRAGNDKKQQNAKPMVAANRGAHFIIIDPSVKHSLPKNWDSQKEQFQRIQEFQDYPESGL
jgi:hypothetical protein